MTENAGKADIQQAIEFAVKAHGSVVRNGSGLPFIVHPLEVLKLLGEWGIKDSIIWKAAICHDVLEDCPEIDILELRSVIGTSALFIVQELTFRPSDSSQLSKKAQKQAYLDSFDKRSLGALVIKVADRCCNTLDFLSTDPRYASIYWDMAKELRKARSARSQEIVDAFGIRTDAAMAGTVSSVAYRLHLATPDT